MSSRALSRDLTGDLQVASVQRGRNPEQRCDHLSDVIPATANR